MSGGTYPVAMTIRELEASDVERVTALWREVDLVRPWNDPDGDFHGAIAGATSAVLGAELGGLLVGTVMVGFDGHRGWLYYVAVAPSAQRSGVGTAR
jgi:ribosomal protein S18 acetylase RimI-like enzyme